MQVIIANPEKAFEYAKQHISTATEAAHTYYCAMHNDTIVGVVGIKGRWRYVMEVCHLYVSTGYRGQGIGLQLVRHAITQWAESLFCATTVTTNDRAVRLFIRAGFRLRCTGRSPYSKRMLHTFEYDTI